MNKKIKILLSNLFILIVGSYLLQIAPTTKYPIFTYVLGGLNILIGLSALIITLTIQLFKNSRNHEN